MSYNHHRARPPASMRSRPGYPGSSSPSSSGSGSASAVAASAISSFADWAARSLDPDTRLTAVQAYVERCCDPINSQPNLSLNLELADHIKQKQANTPRESAFAIVEKINSRHPQISLLALELLDHLVKNVGYPFHLQIATKEFLNELVRRFPERPPLFPSPTQTRILALIHEWKNTLCADSKRKEDLVHIRDMHRLLTYKGYRFPNLDARAKGVMNPENSLQTPDELEEEDRAAQAAKLQELIRRGTPRDLEQAQELMKIMSGAEPESKPDYASQTAKELDKIQSRAILLNDMLNNYSQGEKFVRGDSYDQIASHLRSVQPRIQKWISQDDQQDEGDQQMDRLLLLNDLVNQVWERYQSFKKGEYSAQVNIDPSIDPAKGGASAVPTAKITDLISFEDESNGTTSNKTPAATTGSGSLMDDFEGLTFGDSSSPSSSSTSKPVSAPAGSSSFGGLPADLFDTSKMSQPPAQPSNKFLSNVNPSSTAAAAAGAIPAQNSGSSGLGQWGALQLPVSGTSSSSGSQQQQQPQTKNKDPFEDLLA
ncbi:unnamed protein product [Sympodiomycopsis kandeliae]